MKKSFLPFLFFLLLFFVSASAENILTLTNPNSKETEVFRKGSFLVFSLKADKSVHEGFIRDITDSSLVFDDAQVSLSQIDILAGSTKGKIIAGKIARAVGDVLVIAGTTVFDCGLSFFSIGDGAYYYWPIGGSIWLAGAFVAGLGYVFDWACPIDHTVRVRNHRGWTAAILKEEQAPVVSEKNQPKEEIIPAPKDSVKTINPPAEDKIKKEKNKNSVSDEVYGD